MGNILLKKNAVLSIDHRAVEQLNELMVFEKNVKCKKLKYLENLVDNTGCDVIAVSGSMRQ